MIKDSYKAHFMVADLLFNDWHHLLESYIDTNQSQSKEDWSCWVFKTNIIRKNHIIFLRTSKLWSSSMNISAVFFSALIVVTFGRYHFFLLPLIFRKNMYSYNIRHISNKPNYNQLIFFSISTRSLNSKVRKMCQTSLTIYGWRRSLVAHVKPWSTRVKKNIFKSYFFPIFVHTLATLFMCGQDQRYSFFICLISWFTSSTRVILHFLRARWVTSWYSNSKVTNNNMLSSYPLNINDRLLVIISWEENLVEWTSRLYKTSRLKKGEKWGRVFLFTGEKKPVTTA